MNPSNEIPRLSPSIAKTVIKQSALHGWSEHWLLGGKKRDPSPVMERGQILDALVLGGKDKIYVVDANDWKTKIAKTQRAKAREENLTPVLEGKLAALALIAGEISKRLTDRGIVFDGETQKRVLWDQDGVACKGKLDHFILKDELILDLKITEDASEEGCKRAVTNFRYDIQAAAYIQGIEATHPALAGRVRMAFLFCEPEPPYALNICELGGTFKELGQRAWNRAVKTWGECLASGKWPGYGNEVLTLEAPQWMMSRDQEDEILREFKMVHDLKGA